MSWQEIYALNIEVALLRQFIENQHGVILKDSKIINIDDELKKIKEKLYEYDDIKLSLSNLIERVEKMNIDLSVLTEEVARARTVQSSAVVLIQNLAKELEAVSAQLAAKAAEVPPTFDAAPLNDLIAKLKDSTDGLSQAVASSAGVIPMKEVIMNADNPAVPTVSVTMPEVMPEVVTVTATPLVDTVDPTSTEPQVAIVVEPAKDTVVTSENVVTDVIQTEPGLVDVVVAADAEKHEEVKAETTVDAIAEVKAAYEATPEVTAEPVPEPAPTAEPAKE